MTSWVVWAVTAAVALLIGFTATRFSVRTLRYVTAGIVIILLVAVTAYGQTPARGKAQPDLETAFAFGADRLAGAWFRPLWTLWSSGHAPAPGRLGWSVIAVVLLLGYRQAEKWARQRQAPQLDTTRLSDVQPSIAGDGNGGPPGGLTAGQRHEWLAAELKFRLAAIDVFAPPILPGGTRSEGLASIAESSGVSGANLAAAIIRFLAPLWPAPRRFELRVWVEGTSADERRRGLGAPGAMAQARTALTAVGRGGAERARRTPVQPTRVTVEIDEPGRGATIASKTIVAASIDDAASLVAGYVARQIFARDPASPPWVYGAADGRDLGALGLARQDRVFVETAEDVQQSRRRQIGLLATVTGADRCAGIVRYELAQLWDLERDHFAALRLHAMNREQYPRFFRGRYRLCASLEMIADPAFAVNRPDLAKGILDETLSVLYRAGIVADKDRCAPGDIYLQGAGTPLPYKVRGEDKEVGVYVLSHELRETLLAAARRELRTIRRELWFPVVAWNTFWRRDERAVWQPQWHLGRRQEFGDGVCAAEILVAVKHRLNEKYLVEKDVRLRSGGTGESTAPGTPGRGRRRRRRGAGLVERLWQRKGLQVVAAITGDATAVRTILQKDFSAWPAPRPASSGHGPASGDPAARPRPGQLVAAGPGLRQATSRGFVPPTSDRVRWLPWQARTASWQAAYNTACLYAVLLQQGLATEEQVIASLRRVMNNRDSGIERPYDWISNDPDFAPLLAEDSPYPDIRAFREALERRDYPAKQMFEMHEPQHAPGQAGSHASLAE
jgi:hypothetical protein